MFAARFARSAPRAAAQLRATAQRRFASTQNEFIAERQHLKEHAKGTTGTFLAFHTSGEGPIGRRPGGREMY